MRSIVTLAIGALGAGLALKLHIPMFMISGPAIIVAVAGFAGFPVMMAPVMRNIIFVTLGVILGASVDASAGAAMLRWPIAFAVLAVMMVFVVVANRLALQWLFGFDHDSALLAAAPGFMTRALGADAIENADMGRVSFVQSVRIGLLALAMPVLAMGFGIQTELEAVHPAVEMGLLSFAALLFMSVFTGLGLSKLNMPGALILSGIAISALAQAAGWVKGAPSGDITLVAFIAIGTLLGCRLSVIRGKQLAQGLGAGLVTSVISLLAALGCAFGIATYIGFPVMHIVAAFAPGGLETMVTIGAIVGANVGFVAACHIVRLFVLMVIVPLMLSRKPGNSGGV